MSPVVRIGYVGSGCGLVGDASLLASMLRSCGLNVLEDCAVPAKSAVRRAEYYWDRAKIHLPGAVRRPVNGLELAARTGYGKPVVDLTIHLENIRVDLLLRSRRNWLIPNQEWFRPERIDLLQSVDLVICKTFHAREVFRQLHPQVRFIGFASPAVEHRDIAGRDLSLALHLGGVGSSGDRGTSELVAAWARNPAWPQLVVVVDDPEALRQVLGARRKLSSNLLLRGRLSEDELVDLCGTAGWRMVPSQVEGFGHRIFQAMASGACVVTTDAPPMNELVARDRGYLVHWSRSETVRLGTRFIHDCDQLESDLATILASSKEEIHSRARAGQVWAAKAESDFRKNLQATLADMGIRVSADWQ